MKAVLISIRPKWCELIASGAKKVEVRKTRPKLETPFKAYIYCTNSKETLWVLKETERAFAPEKIASICAAKDVGGTYKGNGKVIGEFTCSAIFPIRVFEDGSIQDYMFHCMDRSLVPYHDIAAYIGKEKTGYGWHISDLVIYEQPKELKSFRSYDVKAYTGENGYPMPTHKIKRAPQSWCYVESL